MLKGSCINRAPPRPQDRRTTPLTVRDRGLVPQDHQQEMVYGELNGHVIDDVTRPRKVKRVTRIRLERNISKTAEDTDSVPGGRARSCIQLSSRYGAMLVDGDAIQSVAVTSRRRLRSTSSSALVVPTTRRTTIRDRAFAVAGPRA